MDTDECGGHNENMVKSVEGVYRNGKVVKRAILRGNGDSVALTDTPDEGTFYRAELRGTPRLGLMQRLIGGRLLALTNPLYAGSWE